MVYTAVNAVKDSNAPGMEPIALFVGLKSSTIIFLNDFKYQCKYNFQEGN